ncbi:hypothetical protein ISG26_35980, partial [Burkholderia pseudomallei]|nr:hypothetical protein [Burkholderia pseudomallei]
AWRRGDDGGWRMARGNPVVRTTEGATRIDPFSRVGARAWRDAAGDATQRSLASGTSGGAADAIAPRAGAGAAAGGDAARVA